MLTHLPIRNYALISHLDIDFHEGFSVMTGETGAGKSIILGALNLVMGARADSKSITEGEERCVIEATFSCLEDGSRAAYGLEDAPSELQTRGERLEARGKEVIIRRELNQNGRSRSFVNDEVVTQAELKALARELIDIHSQHESLMLGDDLFQLQIVDSIAHNQAEQDTYAAAYERYHQALQALRQY
jgi:DNA repair protein RecN (Recombination protein N)